MSTDDYEHQAQRTVTTTRVEVDTVEHTQYECPSCGQYVDEDETTTVTVDDDHQDLLCQYCVESIWQINPDPSASEIVLDELQRWNPKDWFYGITSAVITLAVVGLVLFVFAGIVDGIMTMSTAMAEATQTATQQESLKETTKALTVTIFPLVFLFAVVIPIFSTILGGGRR